MSFHLPQALTFVFSPGDEASLEELMDTASQKFGFPVESLFGGDGEQITDVNAIRLVTPHGLHRAHH